MVSLTWTLPRLGTFVPLGAQASCVSKYIVNRGLKLLTRHFPGSPMVKTHASTAGSIGSILGQETGIMNAITSAARKLKQSKIKVLT